MPQSAARRRIFIHLTEARRVAAVAVVSTVMQGRSLLPLDARPDFARRQPWYFFVHRSCRKLAGASLTVRDNPTLRCIMRPISDKAVKKSRAQPGCGIC